MKLRILIPFAFGLVLLVSCQKSYNPPDLILANRDSTATGTTSQTATPLSKLTITGSATNVVYTYSYDNNKRLSVFDISSVVTSSGTSQTARVRYIFTRDADGKVVQYVYKTNFQNYPDSIVYTMHYPSGSSYFDYMTTAPYTYSGIVSKDSIFFTISNNQIVKYATYDNANNTGYALNSYALFTYDNSANVLKEMDYDVTSSIVATLNSTYDYEYDAKTNALQLGQESLIFDAARYFSKNNQAKATTTDYTTSSAGVKSSTVYTYVYNSLNKPVSATAVDPSNTSSTLQLVYTY